MQQTTGMWNNTVESQKYFSKWKKSASKGYILYD